MTSNKLSGLLVSGIQIVTGLVETLLGLRLVLRLFGANSSNGFVSWVYDTSASVLEPFENIFPTVRLDDGFVLELSTVFAMLVYGIVSAALTAFVLWLAQAATPEPQKKSRK